MNRQAGASAETSVLTSQQAPGRATLLASIILVAALLQGSSFTLTLAFRPPFGGGLLISLVTVLWLSMYLFALTALLVTRGINWVTWLVRYRLSLILLIAGTAFSAMWSVEPSLTIERSVHLIGTTLVAFYLGFSLPLINMLRISAVTLGLLMVASLLSAWFLPALGLQNYEGQLVWAGVMASKNTLGFWSAATFLLLISLSFWPQSTNSLLFYLVLALASLMCLYKSDSATSVLAMLSAGSIMLYLYFSFSLRLGMLAMMVLGILTIALLSIAFNFINTAELIGRSGDLTGRGEVWSQTWKLIQERPLTGYGYGTIWYPTDDSVSIQQSLTDFSWTVYHAHNGLLQIASEVGLPLTFLAVVMILQQLVEIIYCQYQRQQIGALFILGFYVALLVSNYSEARLLVNRELYWIFFIALPISMLHQPIYFPTAQLNGRGPMSSRPAETLNKRRDRSRKQLNRRAVKRRLAGQPATANIPKPTTKPQPSVSDKKGGLPPTPSKRSSVVKKKSVPPKREHNVSEQSASAAGQTKHKTPPIDSGKVKPSDPGNRDTKKRKDSATTN